MKILVDSGQMKQCDKNTIEHFGVPSLVLMERAALCTVEEIEAYQKKSVLLVCGCGNNGGDGLAAARMLWQKGYEVTIVMPPEAKRISAETQAQIDILERYQIPIAHEMPDREFDIVVDALFGIGLTRALAGVYREYVRAMNAMGGIKVAVDIPSGIHGDTGAVMGVAFRADLTVTFAFAKAGLLLFSGAEYAGRVSVRQIGIDRHSFLTEQPDKFYLTEEDLGSIPSRKKRSNKGSYGKVLTVAGRKNMAGAAFLSAKASYLTGAGLVKIVTAKENRVILQQLLPEAILETDTDMPEAVGEAVSWASVLVAGPGLGTDVEAKALIRRILSCAEAPLILDADGLNLTARHLEWLKEAICPIIVTPHLGEMARLTGRPVSYIQEHLMETAREFAGEYGVICVLKDARTVTALPDGRIWVNTSGNNGMATAGAGDVLTGILAGLIAQGMEPEHAACVGVYLHGLAGERMVQARGAYGLMARDILEGIPGVLAGIGQE